MISREDNVRDQYDTSASELTGADAKSVRAARPVLPEARGTRLSEVNFKYSNSSDNRSLSSLKDKLNRIIDPTIGIEGAEKASRKYPMKDEAVYTKSRLCSVLLVKAACVGLVGAGILLNTFAVGGVVRPAPVVIGLVLFVGGAWATKAFVNLRRKLVKQLVQLRREDSEYFS